MAALFLYLFYLPTKKMWLCLLKSREDDLKVWTFAHKVDVALIILKLRTLSVNYLREIQLRFFVMLL